MKGALGTDILSPRHFPGTTASSAAQTGRVGKRMSLRWIHRVPDAPHQLTLWLNRVIRGENRNGNERKDHFLDLSLEKAGKNEIINSETKPLRAYVAKGVHMPLQGFSWWSLQFRAPDTSTNPP
jgi:hypothetical protein